MEILTAAIIIVLLVLCTGVVSLENNLSQSPVMVLISCTPNQPFLAGFYA